MWYWGMEPRVLEIPLQAPGGSSQGKAQSLGEGAGLPFAKSLVMQTTRVLGSPGKADGCILLLCNQECPLETGCHRSTVHPAESCLVWAEGGQDLRGPGFGNRTVLSFVNWCVVHAHGEGGGEGDGSLCDSWRTE